MSVVGASAAEADFAPLAPGADLLFRARPAPVAGRMPAPARALSALPDLDAPPAAPLPAGPSPAEMDALLDAVRAEGFAEGLAAGERDGRAAAEASAARRLDDALSAALLDLGDAADRARAAAEADARALARTLLAALEAGLPGAAARAAPDLLDALVARLGPLLEAPAGATVLVPPALLDLARARLADSGLPVAADPSLPPGDARIGWRGGALLLDLDRRRAAIRDVLASLDLLEDPAP